MGMDLAGVLKAVSIGASIIVPEAGPAINLINQVLTALRNNGIPVPPEMVAREHEMNSGVVTLDAETTGMIAQWRAAHPATAPNP